MAYSVRVWLEIKRLFVEEGRSPREISRIYDQRPTSRAIGRHASEKDEYNKTWYDYRREFAEEQMLARTSSHSLMAKILGQIDRLVSDQHFDASKADQLAKLTKTFREIVDPQYHIQVFLAFAHDFVSFLMAHHEDLVTQELVDAVRAFKAEVKTRVNLGESVLPEKSSEGRPRASVLHLLDSSAAEDR